MNLRPADSIMGISFSVLSMGPNMTQDIKEVTELDYDELLIESDSLNLTIKEKPLIYNDGRLKGNRIAIRKDIETNTKKKCVLAEELGHYYTTVGKIICQSSTSQRKQEQRARLWAYDKLVGLSGIIDSYTAGYTSLPEAAEYLDVTEEFLQETILCYKAKYGVCTRYLNYIIYFEPSLGVFELV